MSSDVLVHGGELGLVSPAIEYEFSVGDRRHFGSRYGFGGPITFASSQAVVSSYPVGSKVAAYYKRHDPSLSCLVPDPDLNALCINLAGGLLCMLLAAFVFWKDYAAQQ